ncbi:MAG: tetratricopeptide repeat protein [Deltaproteobacteria bacterium]|nr:MAG: tetratricopeptide repeat protein [Deltaproteobacteria bacterium]
MKSSVLKTLSIALLFCSLSFLIYANTLESPFIFDDEGRIEENPHIRLTHLSPKELAAAGFNSSKSRPIAFISFALNYYFHQYNPVGYHLVNISLHILTGFILYLFLNTTLKISGPRSPGNHPELIAFLTALIWLVHPVQTQSVTYIVQRMNGLAAMFFILSFWFYVKGRLVATGHTRWLWFAGSVLTWLVSLGCKQITVTLPFLVYLYEWYFFQNLSKDWFKRSLKYVLLIFLLFAVVSFIYLGLNPIEKITSLRDYAQKEFTLSQRIFTQLRVVVYYISLIFFPHPSRLNLDYDFGLSYSLFNPLTTFLSLIAIVALVGLAFYLAQKERLISFCILWFFANLIIESSIIPLAIIFEHRLYLPTMLAVLVPVVLAYRYVKPEKLYIALISAVIIICAYATFERNRDWKDDLTIWTDAAKKSPEKARPHINLGKALANRDRLDEAINHYSIAVRIKPDYAKIHYNLGNAFAKKGKTQEAIERYNHALELKSKFPEVHNNLASVLAKQDKIDQAIAHFSEALRMKPDYAEAHFNLGGVLFKKGMVSEAIKHYAEALQLDPSYSEAHFNLGIALEEQGLTDEAIKQYSEALKINPAYVEAQYNLAFAFHKQGKSSQAITHYESVLSIQPEYIPALNNLAVLYAIEGKYEMAVPLFKKTATLEPDNPGTYYNIARVYAIQGNSQESVDWLKKAIEKGYDDWQGIKTDDSFQNIRGSSEYKSLIEGH